ncbi:MAG: hypothetical protein KF830_00830 [Planctomycetes bacterium]|nr:hypothetical protein [Planctomycetota bacterium]
MTAPPPLPRWFWLLPLGAALAWWPIDPWWKSDDYLALHYAQHLGRALADFVGPQYGATDVWWFYRPLVTLSFWFDQLAFGPSPMWSHASNVLAHAASALWVGLLWRRFLPDGRAFAAALLWALLPGHQAAILWAVGRVDSHTAVWCFATLWLTLRREERRAVGLPAPRWPLWLAFAGALASKELAWVVPPLAAALVALRGDGPIGARLRHGARASAPLWFLLAACFGLRLLVLGRLVGGYGEMQFAWLPMATGLGRTLLHTLVPLGWSGGDALADATGVAAPVWTVVAALPPLAALLLALRRPAWLAAPLLFVVACAPMATFLAGAHNVHNLRYWYLPTAALVGLLAAPGRLAAGLVLLTWLWPLAHVRAEVVAADRESRRLHHALQRAADAAPSGPLFVAGLPHANARGTSLQFHFGVDRVLQPPFREPGVALFALRPIVDAPGIFRLDPPGAVPTRLPLGTTCRRTGEGFEPVPHDAPLPDLELSGDVGGVVDLTTPRLLGLQDGSRPIRLATGATRPEAHRLTIFTATGYFCCLFPDHGEAGTAHGTIDLRRFFVGHPDPPAPQQVPPAVYGPGGSYVMRGLEVPTTHDLVPEFPVLVEAGRIDANGFTATHRARRLLTFRFDRGYARWVRRALGLER